MGLLGTASSSGCRILLRARVQKASLLWDAFLVAPNRSGETRSLGAAGAGYSVEA